MTTAREICERALRKISAIGSGQTSVPGEYSARALEELNEMMHGLNTKGAVIEWQDYLLTDTLPLEPGIVDTVIHALANRCQTLFGVFPADEDLQRRLKSAETRLAGHYKPKRTLGDEFY